MESYSALAASYDELTQDVGYEKRAAFVEKLFLRSHIPVHTVLDLACGTGTMTALLTERGYELIGVDGSEDMLLEAREKAQTLTGVPPLFLHQSMPELDLYGTVEAAICCLDSLNYLTEAREVRETFRRLHLFIAPGGSLVFDVHALGKLEAMDGQVWLDEREDVYCVWRTEYSRRSRLLDYYVDIFSVRADGAGTQLRGAPPALVQRFGADRMADRRRLRRNPRLRRLPPPRPERNRRAHLYFLYPKRVIL